MDWRTLATRLYVRYVRRPITRERDWHHTVGRPPNEYQFSEAKQFAVNFNGGTIETDDLALHALLDVLVADARKQLKGRPHLNVWRIGEITIRFRAGEIVSQMDRCFYEGGLAEGKREEHVSGAV